MRCFVVSCGYDFNSVSCPHETKPSKHSFPTDTRRRQQWLDFISAAENQPIPPVNDPSFKSLRVCSKHFLPDDIYLKNSRPRLHKYAMPRIFDVKILVRQGNTTGRTASGTVNTPDVDHEKTGDADSLVDPLSLDPVNMNPNQPESKLQKKTLRYVGDIPETGISAADAARIIPRMREKLTQKNKALKILRIDNKRLRNKIASLKGLIKTMQQQNTTKERTARCACKGVQRNKKNSGKPIEKPETKNEAENREIAENLLTTPGNDDSFALDLNLQEYLK